jgi:hypothetical protein
LTRSPAVSAASRRSSSSSESLSSVSKPNKEAVWLRNRRPFASEPNTSELEPESEVPTVQVPASPPDESQRESPSSSSTTEAFQSLDTRGHSAQLRRGGPNRKRNMHFLSGQLSSTWRTENDSDTASTKSNDSHSKIVSGSAVHKAHLVQVPKHQRISSMTA